MNITNFPQNATGTQDTAGQAQQGKAGQQAAGQPQQGIQAGQGQAPQQGAPAQQSAGLGQPQQTVGQGQPQQAGEIYQMPQAGGQAPADPLQAAMAMPCPIIKYSNRTLGDLISLDPRALVWLADKFHDDKGTNEAARLLCEHALKASA